MIRYLRKPDFVLLERVRVLMGEVEKVLRKEASDRCVYEFMKAKNLLDVLEVKEVPHSRDKNNDK